MHCRAAGLASRRASGIGVPQISQTTDALRAAGFIDVATTETLVRAWHVEGQSVRPDHRMVAHTGFITTARFLGVA